MKILVEGWRFSCHSYSIVNQFQLREMLTRSDVEIFHREMPYINDSWKTEVNENDPLIQSLKFIPEPKSQQQFDHILRFYCPWNFQGSSQGKTWVFAATEWGFVDDISLQDMGVKSLTETDVNSEIIIITPSEWSKQGFIRSGVNEERITVIPLGFDPHLYYPILPEYRQSLREELKWDNSFIFLNLGGCTERKGIRILLKAFAIITQKYPQTKLVLKASQLIYSSRRYIKKAWEEILTESEKKLVSSRIIYIGEHLSYQKISQLYQAADAYISPYLAEGFNLPVLEAAACGLPIICTQGGPTDMFTHNHFAMKIQSVISSVTSNSKNMLILDPDLEHLVSLMENMIENSTWREQARQFSPSYVRQNFTWEKVTNQLLNLLQNSPNNLFSQSDFEFF